MLRHEPRLIAYGYLVLSCLECVVNDILEIGGRSLVIASACNSLLEGLHRLPCGLEGLRQLLLQLLCRRVYLLRLLDRSNVVFVSGVRRIVVAAVVSVVCGGRVVWVDGWVCAGLHPRHGVRCAKCRWRHAAGEGWEGKRACVSTTKGETNDSAHIDSRVRLVTLGTRAFLFFRREEENDKKRRLVVLGRSARGCSGVAPCTQR